MVRSGVWKTFLHGSFQMVSHYSYLKHLGDSAPSERQVSPEKLYRAALLKNRFADTILKAREKTLSQVGYILGGYCLTYPLSVCLFCEHFQLSLWSNTITSGWQGGPWEIAKGEGGTWTAATERLLFLLLYYSLWCLLNFCICYEWMRNHRWQRFLPFFYPEKARLQAEAKAAEEARRQAEEEAAAEARRKRELEREAARQALLKVTGKQTMCMDLPMYYLSVF